MRIAHVICGLGVGGAENMLVDIANHQAAQGNEVFLIVINDLVDQQVMSTISQEVKCIFVGRPQGSRNPLWLFRYNRSLREIDPDFIHFHDDNAVGMTFRLSKYKTGATVHDTSLVLKHYRKVDRLFAISEAVGADVMKRYGLDSTVVYNGIHISPITPKSAPSLSLTKIVQVSRLDHSKKGQHLLLQALAHPLVRDLALTVDFIGDGPSRDYLIELAGKLGLGDRVHFLGPKPRAYIYSHLCDYDLLVQPSVNEGFGLTIAEGMAARVPVLTSDIEGPLEIIGGGEYGYTFRSEDVDSLAEKIKSIHDSYGDTALIVGKAETYCKNNFDIAVTARRYVDFY